MNCILLPDFSIYSMDGQFAATLISESLTCLINSLSLGVMNR